MSLSCKCFLSIAAMLAAFVTASASHADEITATVGEGWNLVWNDEFEGPEIDQSKWEWETNCWGGGNNELQCYTDRPENSFIRDGKLVIHARKEAFTGPAEPLEWESNAGDRTLPYTSARLRTLNKGDWTYGRFEVRARVPGGQGTWPAIWMLPTDWTYGGWAASGEIDIMETVNLQDDKPLWIKGTLHYGRDWPENVYSGKEFHFTDSDPREDFHTYAIEWAEGEIRWYVDDVHYLTQRQDGWYSQSKDDEGKFFNNEGAAPFDQRFHLLLNVAIGGSWPGDPDDSFQPAEMEIDFVRVFECPTAMKSLRSCATKNRRAQRDFGNVAPQIIEMDYDPNFLDHDEVTIFAEEDMMPFLLGQYVADGDVTVSRIDEGGDRGIVTQASFNTDTAVVYWQAPLGFDLNAFKSISFDLKVVTDPRETGGMVMKMDCFHPCGTGDVSLGDIETGEWHSFTFDLADLVDYPGSSLDLANVNTPLVVFPDWGNQRGVVFRVDNVRLTK